MWSGEATTLIELALPQVVPSVITRPSGRSLQLNTKLGQLSFTCYRRMPGRFERMQLRIPKQGDVSTSRPRMPLRRGSVGITARSANDVLISKGDA